MPRKRKRDQDGIFARPDSPFWWASFTDGGGRATRRSTGVRRDEDPSQLKAKAIRAQWILDAETDRGEATETDVAGHSFDELMLMYLGQVSPGKRAGERDQFSAKRLYPAFSGRALETLGAADARAYVGERTAEGAQPGTVNKEVGLMSAALNWARRELEWDVPNPFQGRRQREPAGRNRWLTRNEAERLFSAAREGGRAPHLTDFIRLGLNTGLRPGEMLELEWARVDSGANLIYLGAEHQKNGKVGSVPLNRDARSAIASRARFRATHCPESPWVFCTKKGARIASIKKGFALAVRRAGLEDVHPHDLRRPFGSWLVQSGVDIRRVSELMRHSDIRVTARVYAHLAPADLADAVEVLDRTPNGGPVSRLGFTLPKTGEEGESSPKVTD
jgi:integrase